MDVYSYEKSDIILNHSCTLSHSESSLIFAIIFCVVMFYAITHLLTVNVSCGALDQYLQYVEMYLWVPIVFVMCQQWL